jgi:diguanylate cyclase (GGDEF)-like protein
MAQDIVMEPAAPAAAVHFAFWSATIYAVMATAILIVLAYRVVAHRNRLAAAIDNMTQGLLLFDAQQRVLICNQRYIEIYGVSPKVVRPGASLRDVIQHRKELGSLTGDVDVYCERVARDLRDGGKAFVLTMADGRSIQILDRPMATGGWVSTHEDITERRRIDKQIEDMAHHDALTGLLNRGAFLGRLRSEFETSGDRRFALLFIDLDRFKEVNDTLGHAAGDALLQAVAARLLACVDQQTDFVARLGGDEFTVIQRNCSGAEGVDALVLRIFTALQEPLDFSGEKIIIDASIGIAIGRDDASDALTLMRHADTAMYRAKAAGRRAHRYYEPAMTKALNAQRRLEADLRQAAAIGDKRAVYSHSAA